MKTSLNKVVWLIILLAFDYIFISNIITGKLAVFLHPKMFKFVYFASAVFVILTIYQIYSISKDGLRVQNFKWGYLIFALPILFSSMQTEAFSRGVIENRATNIGVQKVDFESTDKSTEEIVTQSPEKSTNVVIVTGDQESNAISNDTEILTDDFLSVVNDIQQDLDEWVGRKVVIKGFVFKNDTFDNSRFVVARLWMTCCAADAGVVGIMVQSPQTDQLEADTWVEVSGVIESFEYTDQYTNSTFALPIMYNPSIIKIEPLESQYVY